MYTSEEYVDEVLMENILTDFFGDSKINFKQKIKNYRDWKKKSDAKMRKHDKNYDKKMMKIQKVAEKTGKELHVQYKNDQYAKMSTTVKKGTVTMLDTFKQLFDLKNMDKAILILLWVIVMNAWLVGMLVMIFGSVVGMIIGAVVVAPLIEEGGKAMSIEEDAVGAFFIVFNVTEFLLYIGKIVGAGGKLGKALIVRGVGVLGHFLFTHIQRKARSLDSENGKKIGYGLAVCAHALFNIGAIAANDSVMNWVVR